MVLNDVGRVMTICVGGTRELLEGQRSHGLRRPLQEQERLRLYCAKPRDRRSGVDTWINVSKRVFLGVGTGESLNGALRERLAFDSADAGTVRRSDQTHQAVLDRGAGDI
ncbi:MAG TPA: hypothetical protein VNI77_05225 [Nitrososphaera sp.]|nr:hypothetical protein [Nitrososphaera sp.]